MEAAAVRVHGLEPGAEGDPAVHARLPGLLHPPRRLRQQAPGGPPPISPVNANALLTCLDNSLALKIAISDQ